MKINGKRVKFSYTDIYCPICESELINCSSYSKSCKNKCCMIDSGYGWIDYYIFHEKIACIWDDEIKFWNKRKIKKKIKYWRENDRYLVKILT